MSKKNVLILIPARFASTRFPGKPLAMINGKSMVRRVLENCQSASHPQFHFEAYVVTDHPEIEAHVKTFSPNVVRVDDDVPSGTMRIELAAARFFDEGEWDLVINVQGDEPLLEGSDLARLADFHWGSVFEIATLVKKEKHFGPSFLDPARVKVAMSEPTGKALYFSRAGIPFTREPADAASGDDYWFLHVGVYSYLPKTLEWVSKAPVSRLENLEKLEQLRALELGCAIGALEIQSAIVGVDYPGDIKKVEEVLRDRNE